MTFEYNWLNINILLYISLILLQHLRLFCAGLSCLKSQTDQILGIISFDLIYIAVILHTALLALYKLWAVQLMWPESCHGTVVRWHCNLVLVFSKNMPAEIYATICRPLWSSLFEPRGLEINLYLLLFHSWNQLH